SGSQAVSAYARAHHNLCKRIHLSSVRFRKSEAIPITSAKERLRINSDFHADKISFINESSRGGAAYMYCLLAVPAGAVALYGCGKVSGCVLSNLVPCTEI
ncbi:hypothetical protein GCK32_013544, partial [Trichostrongylus colubriformis]